MSDPQIHLGSSWKSHQQSDRKSLLGNTKNKGNECYSIFGENIKLMETEVLLNSVLQLERREFAEKETKFSRLH